MRSIGIRKLCSPTDEIRGLIVKKITLSADENLIEAARRRAAARNSTLNAQFRLWLEDYAGPEWQAAQAMQAIRELRGKIRVRRKYTREEMNER